MRRKAVLRGKAVLLVMAVLRHKAVLRRKTVLRRRPGSGMRRKAVLRLHCSAIRQLQAAPLPGHQYKRCLAVGVPFFLYSDTRC